MPSREFEELLVQLRSSPIDAGQSLVELRQGFDAMGLAFTPPGDATLVQVDADGVKAEWTRVPESNDTTVLLYLHGGGYIMGLRRVIETSWRESAERERYVHSP